MQLERFERQNPKQKSFQGKNFYIVLTRQLMILQGFWEKIHYCRSVFCFYMCLFYHLSFQYLEKFWFKHVDPFARSTSYWNLAICCLLFSPMAGCGPCIASIWQQHNNYRILQGDMMIMRIYTHSWCMHSCATCLHSYFYLDFSVRSLSLLNFNIHNIAYIHTPTYIGTYTALYSCS